MHHMAGYWLRKCLPSEVGAFAEAVDATVLTAVKRVLGVSFGPSTKVTDTNPVLESLLGWGSFNAISSARRYGQFFNDARGITYAAALREAWGRLHAATAGHISDADANLMEREAETASN
eukprot:jgi/Tetstr1/442283/TSEL_030424.t1